MEPLEIWTDGSAKLHDNCGGWAYVCPLPKGIWIHSGREEGKITNNMMELHAIWMALQIINPRPLIITTDSEYALKAITVWTPMWIERGWISSTGTPVKNRERLEKIAVKIDWLREGGHPPGIRWTRGHDGNGYNELADHHAGLARKGKTMKGFQHEQEPTTTTKATT